MPYLYYPDAHVALDFLVNVFGFEEIEALRDEDGNVWHAQLSTGDGVVLIGPGLEEFGTRAPVTSELVTSRTFVYVNDVDDHYERLQKAGAIAVTGPADHGPNRIHVAADCGGHQWIFATPI